MSQIKAGILFIPGIVIFLIVAGCSDAHKNNNQFDPDTGKHLSNWLPSAHKEAAIAGSSGSLKSRSTTSGSAGISCTECHGADLSGGMSGVSCASCHLGGAVNVHPTDWDPLYLLHGPYANANGTQSCSNRYCHGSDLGGVAQSGPACTTCHLGGATKVHPSSWTTVALSHASYASSNGTASCANQVCHGASLNGVSLSGPSCSSCHLGGSASVHPDTWISVSLDHGAYANTNNTTSCANQACHGASLTGVAQSGPSCSSCHLGGNMSVHPVDWTSAALNHKSYVDRNGVLGCANAACHGATLTGVLRSGPACNSCHLGGTYKIHPDIWSTISINHGPFASANGTASCANQFCHGTTLAGVAQSGPSCSLCHLGGSTRVHPANWSPIYSTHGPYATTNGTLSCSTAACHGTTLAGVSGSGPACTSCHSWPYDPSTVTCGACHLIPPSGNASPDLAGKHAVHAMGAVSSCDICHNGASAYVGNHSNGTLDMAFQAAYTPKSGGTPSYNATTNACSNVSCHGASRTQTYTQATSTVPESTKTQTPSWYTGAINASTQCTVCHVFGSAEYNSYSYGQHFAHLWDTYNGPAVPVPPAQKMECTVCHDITKLGTIHFVGLNTPSLDNPASETLNSRLNWDNTVHRCNPDLGGMTGCHGQKSW